MLTRWLKRRLITRACIFLLLGTVLTVLTAWVSATCWFLDDAADRAQRSDASTDEIQWWNEMVSPRAEDKPTLVLRDESWLGFDSIHMHADPPPGQWWSETFASRWRFGLPLRSMDISLFRTPSGVSASPWWKILVHRDGKERFVLLPLTPTWLGFVVDTLVYAALSALILAGWRRLVRGWRRRRGHCPTCNYDLRATTTGTCPECRSDRIDRSLQSRPISESIT